MSKISFLNLDRLCSSLENKERAMCRRDDCLKGLRLVRVTQMSCDDFLMMGARYQHRDPPSPDMDYIALRVDLRDTRSGTIYQVSSLGSMVYTFFMLVMLAISVYTVLRMIHCLGLLFFYIIILVTWPNSCKSESSDYFFLGLYIFQIV